MVRSDFCNAKRIVIKIGSSLLTTGGQRLNKSAIADWVEQIVAIKQQGQEVLLVSSGSVAEGMSRLGIKQRPKTLHELQAIASIGQMGLIKVFEDNFEQYKLHAAQVLLTHNNIADRRCYLNARGTLLTLLDFGAIPIINENDAVATEEIRFGDNDTLSALVTNLVSAELLIMLTDQTGLFDANPDLNHKARLISNAKVNDSSLDMMAGKSAGSIGRGGMRTKIHAARLASRSGAATVIASGNVNNVIKRIVLGDDIGTYLIPNIAPLVARKQWLAGQQIKGKIIIDQGASNSLKNAGKSLLAVGVKSVSGQFSRGDLVSCVTENQIEIARGLVNYSFEDTCKIAGKPSIEFEMLLGYADDIELIHRDNLIIIHATHK